jgi:hypothetical protein
MLDLLAGMPITAPESRPQVIAVPAPVATEVSQNRRGCSRAAAG